MFPVLCCNDLYAHTHFTKNKQAWYMKTVCIHMYIWTHTYMHIFLYIHILVLLYRRKHLCEMYILSIVSILLYVHSLWNNRMEQFSSLKAQLCALSYMLVHLLYFLVPWGLSCDLYFLALLHIFPPNFCNSHQGFKDCKAKLLSWEWPYHSFTPAVSIKKKKRLNQSYGPGILYQLCSSFLSLTSLYSGIMTFSLWRW